MAGMPNRVFDASFSAAEVGGGVESYGPNRLCIASSNRSECHSSPEEPMSAGSASTAAARTAPCASPSAVISRFSIVSSLITSFSSSSFGSPE